MGCGAAGRRGIYGVQISPVLRGLCPSNRVQSYRERGHSPVRVHNVSYFTPEHEKWTCHPRIAIPKQELRQRLPPSITEIDIVVKGTSRIEPCAAARAARSNRLHRPLVFARRHLVPANTAHHSERIHVSPRDTIMPSQFIMAPVASVIFVTTGETIRNNIQWRMPVNTSPLTIHETPANGWIPAFVLRSVTHAVHHASLFRL